MINKKRLSHRADGLIKPDDNPAKNREYNFQKQCIRPTAIGIDLLLF
ncbi:MAG: hypothetical protein IT249_17670 [Chitinophagaceae bacterium]|nr:hypothetical protein [Chitinophagaceae bacterium]